MDYKKLLLNIPQPIVIIAPDFTILDATDSYFKVTMQGRENLIGRNILEAFPDNPDTSESKNAHKLRASLKSVMETGKPQHLDVLRYDIPKPGGGFVKRYWEAVHQPVLDENGKVQYIVQCTSDVTERELTKHELLESKDQFRFLADSLPLLVDTNNASGESTYFNASWTKYTGISFDNLLEGKWKEAIHPDDFNETTGCWARALKNGQSCQLEFRIKDKDGDYRWHLGRYMPMADESGEVLMWVGSATDIHDTKLMVEELLQTNEQMSEMADHVQKAYKKADAERKVLKNLIMCAPAFCCVLDGPEHVFKLVNDEYQKLFPGRDLIKKTVAEALPEMVGQGFIDLLDQVYNTGEEYSAEEQKVSIDKSNTGKLQDIYVNFIYQPIYDEAQNITGILVFGYEVTDKMTYKKKLEQSGGSESTEAR